MKTSFKKLMAMALVLIMVVSALPVSAMAEYGAEAAKSVPGIMDKVWEGWRDQWLGQLAGRISGRPAQKMQAEAVDGAYVKIDAPNLALPAGTEVRVVKLDDEGMDKVQAIIGNTPGADVKAISAYDITFFCNGKEIEPNGSVSVDMSLLGIEEGKAASIYHIDASAAELNSDMTCEKVENAEVSGSTVSFRAKAFSIYFVAEPEGTRKVKVKFEDGEDNLISTQYISLADFDDYDGMPIYEPSIDNADGTFTGWQTDGESDAMLITDVNEYVYNHFDDIFGVGDSEITFTPTDVTLFFIIYMSGPADDPDTKVISTMPYVVNNGQVRFRVNDTFQKAGTKLESWSGSDNEDYTPGSTATLNVSSFGNTDELILYPVYIEGHWLIFDTNEDANDTANGFTTWANYNSNIYAKPEDDPNVETSRAKLVAPIFVPDGQTPAAVGMPRVFHPGEQSGGVLVGNASDYYLNPESDVYDEFDVYRRGYVLENWYEESAMTNAFDPNEELEDDVTVYAKWSKGQSSVRILLYKEREDSPAFGNNTVAPTFDYFALYLAAEHLGSYSLTGNTYRDRSPERLYNDGAVIETGCAYNTVNKDAVDYCRTHEDNNSNDNRVTNPMQNLFDLEYEYFYFEPDDQRYQKNIDTITHVRGDGTSTLEFYLRRCTYRITLYKDNANSNLTTATSSNWGGNYIFLGAKRSGANTTAPYETVAYDSTRNKWYYVECDGAMNDVCSSPKKYAPTQAYEYMPNDYFTNPARYHGTKLLEFYGLYYSELKNYPKIPENMRLLEVARGGGFPPYPTLYQLKAAEYDQAIYDATQYSRYGGFAPDKTYNEALTLYNYHNYNAAAVRLIETADCDGTYEFKDMEFWHTMGNNPSVGIFNNLRGYFPSYYTIYKVSAGARYWERAYNMDQNTGGSTTGVTKLRTILFTDYYPDTWRAILKEDYGYTDTQLNTNLKLYNALVSKYGDEPLWNGPRTGASSWPEGAFVIKYNTNGTISSVEFKYESEFHTQYPLAYVNYSYLEGTGNDQTWSWTANQRTAFNGTAVFLYHYARKAYPLTYTTPDSAGFGLEAEDNYVVYGLSVNEELAKRPTQFAAYKAEPGFTPAGKYFTGWYTNRDCTEPFNADTKFTTSGKIAVAKYDPIKYRVLIHYGKDDHPDLKFNGSSNMPTPEQSTFLIEHGEKLDAALENVASLEGYSLVGWKVNNEPFNFDSTRIGDNIADMSYGVATYSGKSGTDEFGRAFNDSNDESVQGIIDIYAVWGEDNFNDTSLKIVYDAIYGEGNINGNVIVPDAHVYADGSIAFGRPAATAEGDDMHFAYWELHKPDGSTVRVYPGQRFEVNASDAVPYQPGYDMTWNYKDADGSPLTATNKCLPGQRPTAPAGVPEGYVENGHYYAFQGWTPDPNTIPEEAMTFTARYGAAQDIPNVTITLDYQSVQTNTTATAAYGSSYTVPDVTLAGNSPYYFLGWSKTADGDVAYNANDSVTIDSTSDFTLYAVWASRIIYKDGYNGVGTAMADVITYTDYNASTYSPIGVTELEWAHTGYAFVGWTYNGTTVQPGDTINNPTYPITLTAQWLDGHNVIYHANNGTDATISQFVNYGQSFTFKTASELSGFSRTGYHMTGKLYENAECTGTSYNFGASHASISADLHVYVQWEGDPYTVSYAAGSNASGNMSATQVRYGDTFTVPECTFSHNDPDNYMFTGWSDGTNTYQYRDTFTITGNVTLTAQWDYRPYTINFNSNGGSGTMTAWHRDNGTYPLPDCTFTPPTGMMFKCWSLDSNGSAVTSVTVNNADVKVYAIWQPANLYKKFTGTTFDSSKYYAIGYMANSSTIYLMSSDNATNSSTARGYVSKTYDNGTNTLLSIDEDTLLWTISGGKIKSKATKTFLYESSKQLILSSSGTTWTISKNGSEYDIKTGTNKYINYLTSYSGFRVNQVNTNTQHLVILEKYEPTSGNVLPAPESKLSAATKSEKAVKGNVAAPVVNTTKAAPEIVSRDVTPEPGENVIYLTAVYVERIEDIDGTRIILDANGLTFKQDAKAWIESINGNIEWTDTDHKRIISDPVDFENGIASVKIPGPQVFDQNVQAGYRLIGWNTQPDGSGVEIHFSGITNDAGQYDAKFSSANELQVYIDNLDKGNKNTRINTLYAMWEGYTAFYHSSNNTIEPNDNGPVKYSGNEVGGTLVYSTYAGVDTTVNIPDLVPEGSLYGGYYMDYAGKGSYSTFAVTDGVTGQVAYNGANADWDMTDAYTERGDKFSVAKNKVSDYIGKTIYIKEVPADKYLRLYSYCTYNRADKTIRSWWLITDTDDKNYVDTGFIIDGVVTPCQSWPKSVRITPKNADPNDTETGAKTMSQSTFGAPRAWVPYKGYREDSNNTGSFEALENKTYTNYWITPDNILVIGTRQRTFGSDISNMNTISNNLTNADYTGVKYYYTETVND